MTKDSFPLTRFFVCYQTLENVENYLYRRFSNETNRVLILPLSQFVCPICFVGKPSLKIVFHIFQCLVAQKKPGQWKTIFGQQKTLIKIRLSFYKLFSKKIFWKTIFLSCVASPINIIFVYNRGKHNFLAPSLSHGKFSHFFSLPFAFSLLTPSPSLTLVSPLPIDLSL